MKLYHDSHSSKYRTPFGAVTTGSEICLKLSASGRVNKNCIVNLRLWINGEGEKILPMTLEKSGKNLLFSCTFTLPEKAGLVWYSFSVSDKTMTVFYGNNARNYGGVGQMFQHQDPPSYQITVYEPYEIPQWYRDAIVYQIFPDRFARGSDWIERSTYCLENDNRKGPYRLIRQNWEDTPEYMKDETGAITHWDFFGGTLKGITEKLDYLQNLGITSIYLNPIFEAASNHRYDTADYKKIDSRLGDDESFSELCEQAKEKGIFIILDGVFNHTGNDSVYFDCYKNYGGVGAYNNHGSRYAQWFMFLNNEHTEYESWWGVKDLPTLNKDNPDYQNFIYGDSDSVIRRWIEKGVKGWRLDVADELTDDFIRGIRQAMKASDPESVLMGEVWEDASNKVSHGMMREYLLGDGLDSVMNYPFRTAFIDFLKGITTANLLSSIIKSIQENYPRPAFYSNFNIIGSHDRARIFSILADEIDEKVNNVSVKSCLDKSDGGYTLALRRLRLLTVVQMTLPGVPCIYYGDEVGMQGGSDPYNRAPFPWGREDETVLQIYADAIALRKSSYVFVDGELEIMNFNEDIFGFKRYDNEQTVYVIVNRCPYHGETVTLDTHGDCVYDMISSKTIIPHGNQITVYLDEFGVAVMKVIEKDK